ncbi:MAG: argininosuccinate lyase [Gemmatimonadales bacterium]
MKTLWSPGGSVDRRMLDYTVGNDRVVDAELLRWDVLGSLGHVEGLRAAKILGPTDHRRIRSGLRAALRAVEAGKLRIGSEHEDAHSAVETWLTARIGRAGERLHTGRSRNDQVACDVRLLAKARLLDLHALALALADGCLAFAGKHRRTLWPGYTHLRRAMPSSAGLWAGALAEGLVDTAETVWSLWAQVDRSPLGSAAGYGVPLALDREATARALGFAGVEHSVGATQNGRGKLEAALLFWCVQLGHDLSRLATDVVLFSGEEFGLLELPSRFATGSSIMPQKKNPDVFELTRARVAALEGDLATVLAIRAKLTSGYHRDFQLLKEPLLRGLASTGEMLAMMGAVVPALEVNRERARALVSGGVLATDQALSLVDQGRPFRSAYREVAAALGAGEPMPALSTDELLARRRSTGAVGNLDLAEPRRRVRAERARNTRERRRFERAMARLAGRRR